MKKKHKILYLPIIIAMFIIFVVINKTITEKAYSKIAFLSIHNTGDYGLSRLYLFAKKFLKGAREFKTNSGLSSFNHRNSVLFINGLISYPEITKEIIEKFQNLNSMIFIITLDIKKFKLGSDIKIIEKKNSTKASGLYFY